MSSQHFRNELWTTFCIQRSDPDRVYNSEFYRLFGRMLSYDESAIYKNVVASFDNEDEIVFIEDEKTILSINLEDGVFKIKEADDDRFMRVVGKSVNLIDAMYLVRFKLSERKLLSEVAPEHKWKHVDPESDEWKIFIPEKYKKWFSRNGKFLWSRDEDWGDGGKATIQLFLRYPWKLAYAIYPPDSEEECFYTRCHNDHDDGKLKTLNKTLEEAVIAVAEHAEKFHKRGRP